MVIVWGLTPHADGCGEKLGEGVGKRPTNGGQMGELEWGDDP